MSNQDTEFQHTGHVEQALAQVPFLGGLSADDRRAIAAQVEIREYPEGATIVTQDDAGDTLYIILEGQVQVVRHHDALTLPVPLAEFGAGGFFGEMALLEDQPRVADVIATLPTTCALLTWEVFHTHLLGNREVARALLTHLSYRLRALTEVIERPQVDTKASPEERERRILQAGETAMTSDIRNALVIKEHNHFTLSDPEGNIPAGNTAGLGLYLGDTRHLSTFEVNLERVQPLVLVSTARLGYASEQQLTNRDLVREGQTIRKETMLISRNRVAHDAGFYEQITVSNFNTFPVAIDLRVQFAADFADIFEVRGIGREQRGIHRQPVVDTDTVTLGYVGLDGRTYETALTFQPKPSELDGTHILYHQRVAALGQCALDIRATARAVAQDDATEGKTPSEVPHPQDQIERARRSYDEWLAVATLVETENELFNATITQSLTDLRLLVNGLGDQWYFAAGIPWFGTLFGRDSLITGLQTLAWNPDLAAGILRLLAQYQGKRDDPWRDEEPGKILHELRTGELARTNRVPHTPYYGSIDSTPLFLLLAANYFDWTGDETLIHDLLPNLDAALRWCSAWGDVDGDGYIEYACRSEKGLANQGWKDSGEGIVFQNGRLPKAPIALVEVQGYWYAACRGMARVFRALGDEHAARADELEQRAAKLKERFNADFWMADRDFYALGLDGQKQQIDASTSNPGQALWTGIVAEERAPLVARRLLADALFSGWGIRTLGADMEVYNPLGYHLGTVWPHDNSLIVAGMRRHGLLDSANQVLYALFEAALQFPYYRLPELFCGIARTSYGVPIGYPVASSPQAWAAASLPFMLAQVLGLYPTNGGKVLQVARPVLPEWLGNVTVRGLRVGQGRVDLCFTRNEQPDQPAHVTVEGTSGEVEVRVTDAPPDL